MSVRKLKTFKLAEAGSDFMIMTEKLAEEAKQKQEDNRDFLFDVTASIVLHNNSVDELKATIQSFLTTDLSVKLYLIDNSTTDALKSLATQNISYHFTGKNIGFGAAHNIAIQLVGSLSRYHLILNPDIYYNTGLLEELVNYLDHNSRFSHLMPHILYPDGSTQYLCRERPTLYNIMLKRFLPGFVKKIYKKELDAYEYKNRDYSQFHYNVPFLSGCFMLFRTQNLMEVGGFDPQFFLYFEDADLCHRFLQKNSNVYYPLNFVYHKYHRGTTKNFKLAFSALISFIRFMGKWGINSR